MDHPLEMDHGDQGDHPGIAHHNAGKEHRTKDIVPGCFGIAATKFIACESCGKGFLSVRF